MELNVNSGKAPTNGTLLDKLRPSSRNRYITKKYSLVDNTSTNSTNPDQFFDTNLRLWGIEPIENSVLNTNPGDISQNQSFQVKWNNIVKQRKQEALQLDISTSNINLIANKPDDCSVFSDNMEYINNFIEENYQMVLTENIFITTSELYHSITPFLLISSKTIHRMTLSDYEMKMVKRSFKKKEKTNRIDGIDFYKNGLINFYQGKYFLAYANFKHSYRLRKTDVNIIKWLIFTCLILIFCNTNKSYKIDFRSMKDVEILDQKDNNEEEESFLFGCCVNRKKKVNINYMSNMNYTNNLNMNYQNNTSMSNVSFLNSQENLLVQNNFKINKFSLCKEIELLLKEAISLDNAEKHSIEINWILMIISVYALLRPEQKAFTTCKEYILDAKSYVRKIKDKDMYMGYIVYAEFILLTSSDQIRAKTIYEELVNKFPTKIEAYLGYWYILVKGKDRDYKKAHQVSEIYWRNASIINFDNNIYYLYIMITHAKSLYYLGNNFYTITYFQKEYPANFLYPTIFYLFGKYSSKSKSKSLKTVALSALHESHKLLSEDLQFSALYWIGNVYFNSGNYDSCYKIWKIYTDNSSLCFDFNEKKLEKVKNFRIIYELLSNSLIEFKKNLTYAKKDNLLLKNFNKEINNIPSKIENSEQINDFLSDWKAIKDLNPNIRDNYSVYYEFYRGLIHFYVEGNLLKAIRIFANVINHSKFFLDPYFSLWRILQLKGDTRILLNFSYYIIRVAHNNEVSCEDWLKAYIYYAKALFISKRYDDAIELLRNTLDIFANIPIDEIKFLSEIYKTNKISTTNNFVNFDYALSFYSKYHVYKKSEAIFHFNYKSKGGKEKFLINEKILNPTEIKSRITKSLTMGSYNYMLNNNLKPAPEENFLNNELQNSILINDSLLNNSIKGMYSSNKDNFDKMEDLKKEMNIGSKTGIYDTEIEDLNISSIDLLEEYIEKNIDSIDISEEYTFITIISNPVALYQIGKFNAKCQLKCEMGLYCLKDYLQILKFEYNYELEDRQLIKKYKAYFYIGVIYSYQKQYSLAKQYFDKLKKSYLFENKQNKINFIKAFNEFYKRFTNNNKLEFNFITHLRSL